MRYPNTKMKYKLSYYILFVIGVLFVGSFLFTIVMDTIVEKMEAGMMEGVDYVVEELVIDDKKIVKDANLSIYDVYFPYTSGRVTKQYYLYSKEFMIETDMKTYESVFVGDKIRVYRSVKGNVFTSLKRTKRDNFSNMMEMVCFLCIIMPALGVFILGYLFLFRNNYINPYYISKP